MKIISFIAEPLLICRILEHIDLWQGGQKPLFSCDFDVLRSFPAGVLSLTRFATCCRSEACCRNEKQSF